MDTKPQTQEDWQARIYECLEAFSPGAPIDELNLLAGRRIQIDKMIETVKKNPEDLIIVIADMAKSKPALDSHFVACFTRKLQGNGPALALPLS